MYLITAGTVLSKPYAELTILILGQDHSSLLGDFFSSKYMLCKANGADHD
jgi:hypothetical protein